MSITGWRVHFTRRELTWPREETPFMREFSTLFAGLGERLDDFGCIRRSLGICGRSSTSCGSPGAGSADGMQRPTTGRRMSGGVGGTSGGRGWRTVPGTGRSPRSTSSTYGRSTGPQRCRAISGAAGAGRGLTHRAAPGREVAAAGLLSAVAECGTVRLRYSRAAAAGFPGPVGGAGRCLCGLDGPYGTAVV